MNEELKKEELRGYARGYAAGRKRVKAELSAEQRNKERQAFLDKAFLAALPTCIEVQGWKRGEVPITDLKQRVVLAWNFAEEALKQRRAA